MLHFVRNLSSPTRISGILGWLAWTILAAGCANTCVVGVWNPPTGAVGVVAGNPPPTCAQLTPKAAVRVIAHLSGRCAACSSSNRVQGIRLSVSGIDIHPALMGGNESLEWQKLFPQFETRPLQLDLPASSNDPWKLVDGAVLIPVGGYDRVRLRFAGGSAAVDSSSLFDARCVAANCAMWADGRIEPLPVSSVESSFLSDAAVAQQFFALPDSNNVLVIDVGTSSTIPTPNSGHFLAAISIDTKFEREFAVRPQ